MVYIHVPFCKSFCTYCGFYSVICKTGDAALERYAALICEEIRARRDEILATGGVNTLYFGGGTPSVLPLGVFRRIVSALPFEGPYDEFTVEMNPDDVSGPLLEGLTGLGVNRISLGVQSFDDAVLRRMNRRHDAAAALRAVEAVRRSGVRNLGLDLIFGFPSLSDAIWAGTIKTALELRPEHISCYQLSIEEGSVLERMVADGVFKEASQEQCRRQYDYLCGALAAAGYVHYEISNFALPGFEARHNSAYWSRAPYVGLGPGAHSFDGSNIRRWNSEMADNGKYSSESEVLTAYDAAVERLMLGLRTAAGLPEAELRGITAPEGLQEALSSGLIEIAAGDSFGPRRLRIPEKRFFVSDDIIRCLMMPE